jgi:hypothetical protein
MSLTPKEYVFADTPELCKAIGLDWKPRDYGLLFCVDGDGLHVTAVIDDPGYVALMKASPSAVLAGLECPVDKFTRRRPGWPDEWPREVAASP